MKYYPIHPLNPFLIMGITLLVISYIIISILKYPMSAGTVIIFSPIIFTLYGALLCKFLSEITTHPKIFCQNL
jgi:hypothetical protein